MADQSGPARLKALFESALQAYEKETRVSLDQHPLAVNIQHCQSVDRITTLLQGQVQSFNDFRETDRMMRAIKITVSNLTPLSAFLTNTIGSVRQRALMGCFASLTFFFRHHSHLRKQYKSVLVYY